MSSVRRNFGRFDRELAVTLQIEGAASQGTTVNIGLGGLFVRSSVGATFGATLAFSLSLPTPDMTIEATGKVMWSRPLGDGSFGIGLAFDALRPIDVWGLLQYFNLSSRVAGEPPMSEGDEGDET